MKEPLKLKKVSLEEFFFEIYFHEVLFTYPILFNMNKYVLHNNIVHLMRIITFIFYLKNIKLFQTLKNTFQSKY